MVLQDRPIYSGFYITHFPHMCSYLAVTTKYTMIVETLICFCRFVIVPSTALYYLPVKSLTAVSSTGDIAQWSLCIKQLCMWIIVYSFSSVFSFHRLQTLRHAVSACS